MRILSLVQDTPEWHRHRAISWNASDAPVMLGVSPHMTRRELLDAVATGVPREFSDYVEKKILAPGHRNEALARELAEKIVGDDLYPVIGVPDEPSKLSASFDGITLDELTAWEHKRLNQELREVLSRPDCTGADLPEMYRVQMEQQAMISGAERVLFMASEWDADGNLIEELHCWYTPDPELRARILAGWEQFERDLADHTPEPAAAPAPVGRAPETLPVLRVEAQGMVTFSNLTEFRSNAMAVLGSINRNLQTDEDFADAETTVKWCKGVEERLEAAKANVLAQMQSVDEVCRTIDSVSEETRKVRLELDRLVKAEKEHRRTEIVAAGINAVREHYATINATLAGHALDVPMILASNIGAAIKGKKTLTSIRDAVDTAVAAAKIDASQRADRIRANIAVLDAFKDHAHLFADRVTLCASKAPEDLRNLATARIAEHQKREAERLEAERARIRREEEARAAAAAERARQEEAARIEREQNARNSDAMRSAMAHGQQSMPAEGAPTGAVAPAHPEHAPAAPVRQGAKIKLGDINARIAPLSISADGLEQLGFKSVGRERSAKLYAAADLPKMLDAMAEVIAFGNPQPLRKAG
jgi:predicted phage-related endonuclease